jgi:hypothetical protein
VVGLADHGIEKRGTVSGARHSSRPQERRMTRHTDHTLTWGDRLNLKNESAKPMEVAVEFDDGAEVVAVLPQGGEMKFLVGERPAEIKVSEPDGDPDPSAEAAP